MAAAARCSAELFDARGVRVRELLPLKIFPAGKSRVDIDAGRQLPAGLYWLRFRAGGAERMEKVVVGY